MQSNCYEPQKGAEHDPAHLQALHEATLEHERISAENCNLHDKLKLQA